MGILNDFSKRAQAMPPQDVRNVGESVLFEYRCVEEHGSCDSELWYRSHQTVTIMSKPRGADGSVATSGGSYAGTTRDERLEMGEPLVYRVKFQDGFVGDVSEDELLSSAAEFERPDPPKQKKRRAQSDMENYAEFIEMVPISTLKNIRHVDRVVDPVQTPEQWEELKQELLENGFKKPLIVTYFEGDNTAMLSEGNHRIAIAEQLGITEAPVRVVRYNDTSESHGYGHAAKPVSGHPNAPDGYVPFDLRPSDIGLI